MGLFDRFKKKSALQAQQEARDTKALAVAEKVEKKVATGTPSRGDRPIVPGVLLFPLVTEKGTRLESRGTYQFAVATNTTKPTIARAITARYGVTPSRVRIMARRGKWVRFGRMYGKRSDWKRALVTLPEGKTINVHEGV
ncbi:MAG: 50S ribosomal protein L23 [Candidatus Magasanikbacteria bacterium]|nr:50S ribosomal protein L23 [Candidatus Magasanikbacteria bacterium]